MGHLALPDLKGDHIADFAKGGTIRILNFDLDLARSSSDQTAGLRLIDPELADLEELFDQAGRHL